MRLADHSSKGVLPSALCPVSVFVKPRKVKAVTGIRSKFCKHVRKWLQLTTAGNCEPERLLLLFKRHSTPTARYGYVTRLATIVQ